jgi:hypothetical protein
MGREITPSNASNKAKWDNKIDKARGLIGISISSDLHFTFELKNHMILGKRWNP